jgi:hypothetical protein
MRPVMKQPSPFARCSALVKDHPGTVGLGLCMIVIVHFLLDRIRKFPHVWSQLIAAPISDQVPLYLSVLHASVLIAVFAGVVAAFGLSSQQDAFRRLRIKAGTILTRNWLSVVNSVLIGSGLALLATLLLYSPWKPLSAWFFELSILFCISGILRLLWLSRSLISVVHADDVRSAQAEDEIR